MPPIGFLSLSVRPIVTCCQSLIEIIDLGLEFYCNYFNKRSSDVLRRIRIRTAQGQSRQSLNLE